MHTRVSIVHISVYICTCMYTCVHGIHIYIYIYTVAQVGNRDAEVSIGARWLAPGGAVAEVSDEAQVGWR